MTNSGSTLRRGLMLSACFPIMALMASPVSADQTVVVDTVTPAAAVNAAIVAAINTPDRNISIQVNAPGGVTGPGNLFLSASPGRGDGTVGFGNTGDIGAASGASVTDPVGVQLFGVGGTKDNSLTASNAGLIAGGFSAINFGSTVEFTNSGIIHFGVTGSGRGDVSLLTSGSGTVASGSVNGTSTDTTVSKVDGDFTTNTTTSGNVKIVQADVGTKAAPGSVNGNSRGNTDVSVSGVAGSINATSNGTLTTVNQKFLPPEAGKTVTTGDGSSTISGGVATITLAAGSDVGTVRAIGAAGAKVTADGLVNGTVEARTFGDKSEFRNTTTLDADGKLVGTTNASSSTAFGGAASVALGKMSDAQSVTATGAGGAAVTADGIVRGGISATSSANSSTNSNASTFAPGGLTTASEFANASTAVGKAASVTTGAGSDVSGAIFVSGHGGATVVVGGKAGSVAQADASASNSSFSGKSTFDGTTGGLLTSDNSSSFTAVGGAASATLGAEGTLAFGLNASSNAGDAAVTVAGKGESSASATSVGNSSSSQSAQTFDGKGLQLSSTTSNMSKAAGGKASATVAETGTLAGSVSASGQGGASTTVAGTVALGASASSTGTTVLTEGSSASSYDEKGVQTSSTSSSKTTRTATGGTGVVTIADKASVGSVSASGDAGASAVNNGKVLGGVNVSSNRFLTDSSENSSSSSKESTAEVSKTASSFANSSRSTRAGGTASFTNGATGQVGETFGSVNVNGIGGATIVNEGTVRGTISASSQYFVSAFSFSSSDSSSTVFGVAPALDVTTTSSITSSKNSSMSAGGNVTGTYAGTSGTFDKLPAADGSVTQQAHGVSSATVSGKLYGNLSSLAGQQTSTVDSNDSRFDQTLDSEGSGSRTSVSNFESSSTRGSGGSSKVTVSGTVGTGNTGGGSINATGSESSSVTIAGGTVGGSVNVTANGVSIGNSKSADSYAQTLTKSVAETTALSDISSNSSTTTLGVASAQVSGAGSVAGGASVNGVSGSTVMTGADSKVGGGISAFISGASDTSSTSSQTYTRDSKTGVVASLDSSEGKSAPSAAGGNASASAAGTVGGGVSAVAQSGVATATVTGSAAGTVVAQTGATTFTNSNRTSFNGELPASGSTFFGGLGIPNPGSPIPAGGKLEVVSTSSSTMSGGGASVLIDQTAAFQGKAGAGAGTASASGMGGASVVIGSGSRVTGGVSASSSGTNSTSTSTTTYLPIGTQSSSRSTQTALGSTATVDNKGQVGGNVGASGLAGVTVNNSGTISGGVTLTSNRGVTLVNESSNTNTLESSKTGSNAVFRTANAFTTNQVGGAASFTNSATGLVGNPSGFVSIDAIGGVTLVNNGDVRGTTNANSTGVNSASSSSFDQTSTTVLGIAPALDVTTFAETRKNSNINTAVGGNVTGTYAGANGTLNFSPPANGTVSQTALRESSATVSGALFGNLTSAAGQVTANSSSSESSTNSTIDSAGTGTRTGSNSGASSSDRGAGGVSKVSVTGIVGAGNVGGGNVTSNGAVSSAVTVGGGTVDGNVSVSANGVVTSQSKNSGSYAQNQTKFVAVTSSLTEASGASSTVAAGAASAELTGTGRVGGNLTVSGLSGATASAAVDTKVGGSVSASILGSRDTSSSASNSYTRDAKTGIVASLAIADSKSAPSAAAGNAAATVAGTVGGGVSANAGNGTATATVTGSAGGAVSAGTGNTQTVTSSKTSYAGVLPGSSGTNFASLGIPTAGSTIPFGGKLETSSSSTTTWGGGKASVLIDTAAALQSKGTVGAGSVFASGIAGASADITAGSRVAGSVSATSGATNSSTSSTGIYQPTTSTLTTVSQQTAIGGPAAVVNKGEVGGSLVASSVGGATISNSGKAGGASASSIATDRTVTTVDVDAAIPARRVLTTTTAARSVGGTAAITNAAGAVVNGGVFLSGKSGTLTNSGFITGTTTLGQSVLDGTEVTTQTDTSTKYAFTPSVTRFAQGYTVEQSGISRGFNVSGATAAYSNPQTGVVDTVRTSDVTATINLNSGSVTLGDIIAQTDSKTGERLTATTVNMKGSGWLGADVLAAVPPATNSRTPSLTLSPEAHKLFGTAAIRVEGVATLQKQDAGTFVIHGRELVPSPAVGTPAVYTLDVGQFTVNGGEVQLAHNGTMPTSAFGIRGNVTNNATLVIGRRVPNTPEPFGNSIVGIGPETIAGVTVTQVGNFTQGATGTLVAAVTPSLVRFGSVSLTPGGAASEPLGPVTGGVSIPFFTTPANAGVIPAASRVNVNGNLSLAGTVQAVVTRDSLFSDNDGYTLFTYTGTGTVSATVTPTISSPFVSFTLVNDAAAKTVRFSARRSSFAPAAADDNARAAATALDSAVSEVTARIRNDAGGGAGFATVGELSNAQDIANIVSALDWRLSSEQAAQVFEELSSAEIYGSLAAIDQNIVFGQTAQLLSNQLSAGQPLKTRLWLNPVGDFAKFDGSNTTGASSIRSTAYGLAFGADVAYSDNGAFGIGGAYGEHDVTSSGSPDNARVRTWTIGAYAAQSFGQAYVNGMLAYGFSRFNVDRSMELLSRSVSSSFRGTQFDAAIEGGYNFPIGGNFVATPYAELAVRSWQMNAATEDGSGGGGVAVNVEDSSSSVFSPTIGGRIGGAFDTGNSFVLLPHARLSYTFQGDVGSDRTVRLVGGGDSFTVQGVDPGGYGTIEAGLDSVVQGRFNLFARIGYSFSGGTDITSVRGGISFGF
jgi:hypothetical protein